MSARSAATTILFVALAIAVGTSPVFAVFGYTPVYPPVYPGEKNHAEILGDIYGQTFTSDGANYVGDGGVTAYRVYDFDDIVYNTTHVYNHSPNDVDQIWTDGVVTITAVAKYASYQQAFGWNEGGLGTEFTMLVDDQHIDEPVTFQIEEGEQFLWGYQAKGNPYCGWWQPGLEWWSKPDKHHHCVGEDHMVTYFIDGVSSSETVWAIFLEDLRLYESDKDYNDFVVEIRAIPEPASILLLGLGTLALLRKRRA